MLAYHGAPHGGGSTNLGAAQRALSSRFLAAGFVDRTRIVVRAAGAAAPIELSGSGEPTTINLVSRRKKLVRASRAHL